MVQQPLVKVASQDDSDLDPLASGITLPVNTLQEFENLEAALTGQEYYACLVKMVVSSK